MKQLAIIFGRSLDKDDFKTTASVLAEDCVYRIGKELLIGPELINGSYEKNMLEGRRKFDKLEWGESFIEEISDNQYYVNFTDYLGHAGEEYVHRCKQKLTVEDDKIVHIEHIHEQEEQDRLDAWCRKVGLK